ncbi:MAG: hypothetical protein M0O92_05970, partial [Acholeplasmataceae bacterium]|nr:hypothetical protein [Acholeplasmataceae bacterium]
MTENPLLREISLLKDKIDGMGRVILKAGCRLTVDETVCISELMRKSEALEQSVVTINNYLGSPEADLSGYVTLATQQNIWGQKNFDKQIGVGTRHPQNMLHINIPYEEYMGGIQITRGWVRYGDSDDGSDLGLNIRIAGSDALYSVSYTG